MRKKKNRTARVNASRVSRFMEYLFGCTFYWYFYFFFLFVYNIIYFNQKNTIIEKKTTIWKYILRLRLRAWIFVEISSIVTSKLSSSQNNLARQDFRGQSIILPRFFPFSVSHSMFIVQPNIVSMTTCVLPNGLPVWHIHSLRLIQVSVLSRVSITCYALSFICLRILFVFSRSFSVHSITHTHSSCPSSSFYLLDSRMIIRIIAVISIFSIVLCKIADNGMCSHTDGGRLVLKRDCSFQIQFFL